jgi:hypothetical protein
MYCHGYVSLRLTVAAGLAVLSGCGSSGSDPGGGGGAAGGGMPAAALPYKPCEPAARVGGFSVQLIAARTGDTAAPAITQVAGGVNDRGDPADARETAARDGDCKLLVGPQLVCNPTCAGSQICAGQGRCVAAPASQMVGTVTITGLAAPIALTPIVSSDIVRYYTSLPASTPFPPFGAEAEVELAAAGGAYGAFTLAGRGIEPLVFAGAGLAVAHDRPLAISWTPPAKAASARILMVLDIAHHGGIPARVECDVADTGAATIPAGLIGKLVERGTAGFPTISLTRRTVDSTALAPGCVDFSVASSIERDVQVENVISCGGDLPCPGGRTCGVDQKCE